MGNGESQSEKNINAEAQPDARPPENLPFLLDFSLSVAQLVVILAGLATAGVSILAGAVPWVAAARGGAAALVIGLVLWAANYRLSKDALEQARQELLNQAQNPGDERIASTLEKTA